MISLIKKLKNILGLQRLSRIYSQTLELEWAHIFHDSIRDKQYLQGLSLNIGRWAGNYAFFYVLNRILNECRPNNILELGLGESSKFISAYLDNELKDAQHYIVEHDADWIENFTSRFTLSNRSLVIQSDLTKVSVKGFPVTSYKDFGLKFVGKYDLYIIDGPFGSSRYSRFDIFAQVEKFQKEDEFILVFDDTNRFGDLETANFVAGHLKAKGIQIYTATYVGNKSLTVVVSQKYRFVTSF